MSALVDFEPSRAGVALATDVAGKRLIPRVDQLMRLQVAFGDELFVTVGKRTGERSFSSLKQRGAISETVKIGAELGNFGLHGCADGS